MIEKSFGLLALVLLGGSLSMAETSLEIGKKAPDFELSDSAGKTYRLSELAGERFVVLEFFRSGSW